MTQVGSAEVEVRVNLDPLTSGLSTGEAAVKKFDASVTKSADSIEKKFNTASKNGEQQAGKFAQSIGKIGSSLNAIPGPIGSVTSRFSSLLAAAVPAAAGFAVLAAGLIKSVNEAEKFEQINLKTEALLKATGFAAGVTASQINDLGESIESATLATSEDVQKAAQHLITFGNVSGEQFKRTITLAEDLAAATGTDLVSATERFGKAFENPLQSARLFRDIGLHEVVLLQADALQKAGKEAESYDLILDAVTKKVGGTGGAAAQGLSGSFHRLNDAVGDAARAFGESGPLQAWTAVVEHTAESVRSITDDMTSGKSKIIEWSAAFGNSIPILGSIIDISSRFAKAQNQTTSSTRLLNIEMGKNGVIQTDSLKRSADIALKQKAANDKEAAAIKKATEDAKKAAEEAIAKAKAEAEALKNLNERRAEAIKLSGEEADNLENLVPKLLASGQSEQQMTKEFQFQIQLLAKLSSLHLERGSAQGKELEDNLRRQQKLNEELTGEIQKRSLLKDVKNQIAQIDVETASTNLGTVQQQQVKFAQQLTQENERLAEGYRLTTEEIQKQAAAFGRATGAHEWAAITKELTLETNALSVELDVQTVALTKGTKEAAAFKFEQDALTKITQTFGSVSAEQAAQVKFLSDAYGEATLKLEKLKEQAETNDFLNGNLKDGLKDLVLEGKSIGEVFGNMGKKIREAAFEAAVFGEGPLASLFGTSNKTGGGGLLSGIFGGASGTGENSLFGGAGKFLSSIFHEGGSDHGMAPKRHVRIPSTAPVPRFHSGLKSNEFLAILEKGEEVSSRREVSSRKEGRGGGTNIFNIQTPDVNSFMASKRQLAASTRRAIDRPGL